ncbi:hypothetical protein GCM10027610_034620 [Dactylosporangium cerinum]
MIAVRWWQGWGVAVVDQAAALYGLHDDRIEQEGSAVVLAGVEGEDTNRCAPRIPPEARACLPFALWFTMVLGGLGLLMLAGSVPSCGSRSSDAAESACSLPASPCSRCT